MFSVPQKIDSKLEPTQIIDDAKATSSWRTPPLQSFLPQKTAHGQCSLIILGCLMSESKIKSWRKASGRPFCVWEYLQPFEVFIIMPIKAPTKSTDVTVIRCNIGLEPLHRTRWAFSPPRHFRCIGCWEGSWSFNSYLVEPCTLRFLHPLW